MALSLEQKEFLTYTSAQKEELLKQTKAFVATYLEFTLEPIGRVQPAFTPQRRREISSKITSALP
jgi:hypothetical protein